MLCFETIYQLSVLVIAGERLVMYMNSPMYAHTHTHTHTHTHPHTHMHTHTHTHTHDSHTCTCLQDVEGEREEGDPNRHVTVIETSTGTKITGEDAPIKSELKKWLQEHPG